MSSNTRHTNTSVWDENRGRIRSSKGGWIIGKGVFNHGYSMLDDLVGKFSYMQVLILNAIGKIPDRKIADWFEAAHICLSWPDPRIWCNQIGALAGTNQTSVIAATVSGILANDSRIYGSRTIIEGMHFIQRAYEAYSRGVTVDDIVKQACDLHGGKPHIMGYARPIAKGDERIAAMERTQKELGIPIGKHQRLAYEIEEILLRNFDESMNINGYMSSFLSDHGFTSEEVYRCLAILVNSGVTACYVDTRDKPAESFLPLRCDDIDYQGPPPREVP